MVLIYFGFKWLIWVVVYCLYFGFGFVCFAVVRWLLVVCLDLLVVCFFDCCLCSIDLVVVVWLCCFCGFTVGGFCLGWGCFCGYLCCVCCGPVVLFVYGVTPALWLLLDLLAWGGWFVMV